MPLPKNKSKCAPAIWKKFTDSEKLLWQMYYDMFLIPEQYHIDWCEKEFSKQRQVTAHNMACQVVWSLSRDIKTVIVPV